jgi:hypothetical protein
MTAVPAKSSSAEKPMSTGKPVSTPDLAQAVRAEGKADDLAVKRREAGIRALAETAKRHAEADRGAAAKPEEGERFGRGGLDPVRYGDWEVKGIATDF